MWGAATSAEGRGQRIKSASGLIWLTVPAPWAFTGLLKDGKLIGEFDAGQMKGKWEAQKK